MAPGEFQLIERHLSHLGAARADVVLGPGDDAALLRPGGRGLAVVHASVNTGGAPRDAARRCLDEALRALAATGAEPAWATLALSLTDPDEAWLAAYAEALDAACREAGVRVVGGDVTAGTDAATLFLTGLLGAPPGPG